MLSYTCPHCGNPFDDAIWSAARGCCPHCCKVVALPSRGLQEQLLSLLTRRTQQARRDAEVDFRKLLEAIGFVEQASKLAEHSLLAFGITKNMACKRLNQTRFATYVLAVRERAFAREQREIVLKAAQRELTGEIKKCEETQLHANATIQTLNMDANRQRETARSAGDSASTGGLKILNCFLASFCLAVLFGCCCVSPQVFEIPSDRTKGIRIVNPISRLNSEGIAALVILPIVVILLPALIGMLIALGRIITVCSKKSNRHRRIRAIDRELAREVLQLEGKILLEGAKLEKLRRALAWLQAQS